MLPSSSLSRNDRTLNLIVIVLMTILLLCLLYSHISLFLSDDLKPEVDYLPFWAAGKLALENAAHSVYDNDAVNAVEQLVIPSGDYFLPWLNPPTFLVFMNALSYFDFVTSFWIWSLITAGLYLITAWSMFPNRYYFLAACFFPPFYWCLLVGQSSALIAALTIIALVNLEKKPYLSGFLIGLLAIKPQAAILIPVALLASRNWKAFISATISLSIFVLVSIQLYGLDLWFQFYASTQDRINLLYTLNDYESYYLQSLYGLFLYLNLGSDVGKVFQLLLAPLLIGLVFWAWRRNSISRINKIALLIISTLMFQSYSLIYEYTSLFFVIALLVGIASDKYILKRTIIILSGSALCLGLMLVKLPGGFPLCLFLLGVIFYDIRNLEKQSR